MEALLILEQPLFVWPQITCTYFILVYTSKVVHISGYFPGVEQLKAKK